MTGALRVGRLVLELLGACVIAGFVVAVAEDEYRAHVRRRSMATSVAARPRYAR